MPAVRGLEDFLRSNGLIRKASVTELKSCVVAIDAFQWLRTSSLLKREPLQVPLGGSPLALRRNLAGEIGFLTKHDIQPIFVFNGLRPAENFRPPLSSSRSRKYIEKRNAAWTAGEKGKPKAATALFSQLGGYVSVHLQNRVLIELQRMGIRAFRAPYSASSQLAALSSGRMTHVVFGGLELLLYKIERVVTGFNWAKGTVEWVDSSDVLKHLGVGHDRFVDMCLLSGFEVCRTFPPLLNNSTRRRFFFQSAVDVVLEHGSGTDAISSVMDLHNQIVAREQVANGAQGRVTLTDVLTHMIDEEGEEGGGNDDNAAMETYRDLFLKVRERVQKPQVLQLGIPPTVALPRQLFVLLAKGVISPYLPNAATSGVIIDTTPLVDSYDYAESLDVHLPGRGRSLDILLDAFGERYREQTISVWRWFKPNKRETLKRDPAAVERWKAAFVAPLAPSGPTLLASLAAGEPPAERSALDDARARVFRGLLDLYEYRTSEGPTERGKALPAAAPEYQEHLLLASELLRYGFLTADRFRLIDATGEVCYSNAGELNDPQARKEAPLRMLLSRVATLLPVDCKQEAWTGALSRELAAFLCVVTGFQRGLRNALDAVLAWGCCSEAVELPAAQVLELDATLPYRAEPSCAMGILMEAFLKFPKLSCEELAELFPQVRDVRASLRRCYAFFNLVRAVASWEAAQGKVTAKLNTRFGEAEELLQKHAKRLGVEAVD